MWLIDSTDRGLKGNLKIHSVKSSPSEIGVGNITYEAEIVPKVSSQEFTKIISVIRYVSRSEEEFAM